MSDFRPVDNNDPYSLESILAEYKGTAYIDGDRRSSEDLLDAQIDQIVTQSAEGTLGEEFLGGEPEIIRGEPSDPADEPAAFEPGQLPEPDPELIPGPESAADIAAETVRFEPVSSAGKTPQDSGVWENPFADQADDSESAADIGHPGQPAEEFGETGTDPESDEYGGRDFQDPDKDESGFSFLSLFRRKRKTADGIKEESRADAAADSPEDAGTEEPGMTEEPYGPETADLPGTGGDGPDGSSEEAANEPYEPAAVPAEEAPQEQTDDQGADNEILFFDDYRFAESDEGKEFQTTWDETFYADGEDTDEGTEAIDPLGGLKSVFRRFRRGRDAADGDAGEKISEPKVEEDVFVPEPDYSETADAWAKKRHGLMLRSRAALVLASVMTVITILFERGVYLPGINANGYVLTAVLAIMQLVVMALAVDLLVRGGEDLIRLKPGYETLLLLSSLVVLFCCFGVLKKHDATANAPFCCVSAFAMALSLWGEYRQVAAMNLSLKTAAASDTPEVFVSDYIPEIECNLIKHHSGPADGFYNNLVETDAAESAYRALAPIFVCLVILFSLVGTLGSGTPFFRCLAASAAASASFSALSAFGVPFSLVARRLRRSGSAVAGWGGADTVYYADGIRICENDLFPAGATITGIKIFDQKQAEKVIRYTGSLLSAAQSGLAGPFGDFMDRQGISHMRIDSYEICEGGFSTLVRNENILCGTASCLSLYGVPVPQELNLKNAMYVALDGKLSGIITVAYRPTKSVQSAMMSMLRSRLKLFVAGRDFNISPLMVQQKLQIPVDDMEYLPFRQACAAAENEPEKVPHAAAVSVHSTPGTVAETVIGARRLRIIAGINTVISVVTAVLGMLIMLLFARLGAGGSVSPSSLCEYMLAMEVITILISYVA